MSTAPLAVLRIELLDIEPLIWRRTEVPTSYSLQTLHRVIQATMGWLDYHLWEFTVDGKKYGVPNPEHAAWGYEIDDAGTITLAHLIERGITAFVYTYDMGDNWQHGVMVERVFAAEAETVYPRFLGGERRRPPEDCGGVSGYHEFLEAIAGPDKGKGSRRKREMLAWYGRPYDPDNLDEAQVRAALKRLNTVRSSRRGAAST